MNLYRVISDAFTAVGYDQDRQTLRLKFTSGDVWDYEMPTEEAEAFQNAPSLGKYYHSYIKGQFPCSKFEDGYDGLDRRLNIEPVEMDFNHLGQLICADGRTITIDLEATDLLPDAIDALMGRLAALINAVATVPTQKIQEVVDAGLIALHMRDRRAQEEMCPEGCGHEVQIHEWAQDEEDEEGIGDNPFPSGAMVCQSPGCDCIYSSCPF